VVGQCSSVGAQGCGATLAGVGRGAGCATFGEGRPGVTQPSRIRKGLRRAAELGVRIGRRVTGPSGETVRELRGQGLSWSDIGILLDCTSSSVRRAYKRIDGAKKSTSILK